MVIQLPRDIEERLNALAERAYRLDLGVGNVVRVLTSIDRYRDRPLGFLDAAVIACAECNGGQVLTSDYRHFGVMPHEGTITLVS